MNPYASLRSGEESKVLWSTRYFSEVMVDSIVRSLICFGSVCTLITTTDTPKVIVDPFHPVIVEQMVEIGGSFAGKPDSPDYQYYHGPHQRIELPGHLQKDIECVHTLLQLRFNYKGMI
jgi:hypothetical protein